MQPFKSLVLALALAGCAGQGRGPDNFAPTPSPLHSEFSASDVDATTYGPFVAATLAQQDAQHASAARYYLEALQADPDSEFVADRAFFQLLYAGRMDDAASLAVKMQGKASMASDDLVRLMFALEAYKREDWPAVRERLSGSEGTGFGFLVSPLLTAWAYTAEGDLAGASKALAPMMADAQLGVIAEEHFAYMLDHLNKTEAAETAYMSLVSAEKPASLQPLVAYADLLRRKGDMAGAREFLGKQTERFPGNRFLLHEGRRIAAGFGPSQDATSPRGAAGLIFYRLASEFAQSRTSQAAVVYFRVASYLTPEVSEIYFMLGNLLEQLDTPGEAVNAYAAVPPSSELRAVADLRRIGALRQAGREDEAEGMLRSALRDNPESAPHLTALADMLRDREEFTEAAHYYTRAISHIPQPQKNDWFLFFARGVCFERMGSWDKAEADLMRALALNPGEAAVLNYLGYSWIDKGKNIDKAKHMIEQAVAEQPDDGFIIDSLGWVHFLTGNFDEAVKMLEQAVRLEPTDATINDHLGDAYWRVGRKIEARFQWRHALDNGPSDEERQAITDKLEVGLPKQPS